MVDPCEARLAYFVKQQNGKKFYLHVAYCLSESHREEKDAHTFPSFSLGLDASLVAFLVPEDSAQPLTLYVEESDG